MQERMEAAALTYKQPQSAQPQIRQLTEDEIAQGCKLDPCIGMRVQRLWPEVSGLIGVMCQPHCALCPGLVKTACMQWLSLHVCYRDIIPYLIWLSRLQCQSLRECCMGIIACLI